MSIMPHLFATSRRKPSCRAQLVESERLAAIGTTAAKIGHELANPLNGMSLTIQLLEQRLKQNNRWFGQSFDSHHQETQG